MVVVVVVVSAAFDAGNWYLSIMFGKIDAATVQRWYSDCTADIQRWSRGGSCHKARRSNWKSSEAATRTFTIPSRHTIKLAFSILPLRSVRTAPTPPARSRCCFTDSTTLIISICLVGEQKFSSPPRRESPESMSERGGAQVRLSACASFRLASQARPGKPRGAKRVSKFRGDARLQTRVGAQKLLAKKLMHSRSDVLRFLLWQLWRESRNISVRKKPIMVVECECGDSHDVHHR